jgi:hypothetical protein
MKSPWLIFVLASACAVPGGDEQTFELTGTTIVSLTFDDGFADQQTRELGGRSQL